ncbi:zinc metalloprotease HtpX [Liquorilactobacillus satsumensis]|uniref:Protease HtpX homolog n=1 Tax=Liquorilactobacillus satsumensis DSM 16230 = JCM 12392 TaxID=1423801 RepID=A0A0R1V339_9LACO|nr:zinc metalloprotease HtpX [Liquorilactobacillus satsumensis]KRM00042.1 heat shock protein HtpX [Liquorilactobacillus satsumensis DSM 16230 = JCM 12392]MCC7667001.1 zinc metalloprotease HtpX [Liquorilactobacillus satsumensis]MCP9313587.1 zinc metalloprotease HtpX [Liquorilactobacillus satsumensis]MCP9329701.1 zinc metalloprotease HtpX [Liquorilactobacillus satsumensis]MCP9358159.1 zinc metalloprotease HtpX [Liquorilactobacillus satsumensis]
MLFQQIARNKRRTVYVMIAFFLLVLVIGAAVGYVFFNNSALGIVMAAVLGVFYMLAMLSRSTEIVMGMNHAEEIQQESDFPELWHVVEDMALVGRVPMPRVFVIADESPNAFATGNNPEHSAVAVTQGLLERLNREELEGVIAHEISHIRNYDIRLQTTALALSAVISALVNLGFNSFWWGGGRRRDNEGGGANAILMVLSIVVVILAPVAATLAQLALSRNREYLADASGVELTRNPQGLINALDKISQSEPMKAADPSSSSLYIANPFKSGSWTHLFDTHPPIEDRIARLRKM